MHRVLPFALVACTAPTDDTPSAPHLGTVTGAATVESMVASSCSTTSVWGLSEQVVAMVNCLHPGTLVEVSPGANVSFGGAVFPYMQAPARDAFEAATASTSKSLGVNSMLRTVIQQYLLYRWYQAGDCGIGLAAKPGTSNHESGLAFDTSDANAWVSTLESFDFAWLGNADPVHFDYAGPGIVDLGGEDVRAFQMLWNLHNPDDLIDEDGLYGPQTAARIQASPADGFPGTVVCPGQDPVPDVAEPPPDDVAAPPLDAGPADPDTGSPDPGPDIEAPDTEAPDVTAPRDIALPPDDVAPPGDTDAPGDDLTTADDVAPGDAPPDVAAPPPDTAAGDASSGSVIGSVVQPAGGCSTGRPPQLPLLAALGLVALLLRTRRR